MSLISPIMFSSIIFFFSNTDPKHIMIEISKPTSDCRIDSVVVWINGEIVGKAGYGSTGKLTDYGNINNSYEYYHVTIVGYPCGNHTMLTQAYISSFHGGNPLIEPGLYFFSIYPKLTRLQRFMKLFRESLGLPFDPMRYCRTLRSKQ